MNENDPMDETCLSTVIKQKLLCAFCSVQKKFSIYFCIFHGEKISVWLDVYLEANNCTSTHIERWKKAAPAHTKVIETKAGDSINFHSQHRPTHTPDVTQSSCTAASGFSIRNWFPDEMNWICGHDGNLHLNDVLIGDFFRFVFRRLLWLDWDFTPPSHWRWSDNREKSPENDRRGSEM